MFISRSNRYFVWWSTRWAVGLLVLLAASVVEAQSVDAFAAGQGQGPIRLRQPTYTSLRDLDCFAPAAVVVAGNQATNSMQGVGLGEGRDARSGSEFVDASSEGTGSVDRRGAMGRSQGDMVSTDERIAHRDAVETFESYLRKLGMHDVRRFGSELWVPRTKPECVDGNTIVPPDYALAPGDELMVTMWGAVDADLHLMVDRSGRVTIPRVGAVMVAGVRYADLPALITRRAQQVFKNFQVSVALGQLRGVRVYVTGHVKRPGAYTMNSLSTVVAALLKAGGPSASGSFRDIQVRRGREVVTSFDLYDLLVNGDRSADRLIQADDVVHVGPVGSQVAMVGAVNKPAIFEVRKNEKVQDVVAMAGGLGAVADRSRLTVERLVDRAANRVTELKLPSALDQTPTSGDVYRALSAVDSVLPVAQQNKRVRIEGEVVRPGDYLMPPASSIQDALRMAGGMTPAAYVFGTEFSRESVRVSQQENYDRALRDLETEFARASTQRAVDAADVAAQGARVASTQRLVERLRSIKPSGRIVLQIPPNVQQLPDLALEDGDRIYVPAKPTSVGVFGSVFNGGSFLYGDARSISDFLSMAGGPTRGADSESTFVLRANGSVISNRQKSSLFGYVGGVRSLAAEPGDTIFVPEEVNKTTWVQDVKEWTAILYQFGLGAAALKALGY